MGSYHTTANEVIGALNMPQMTSFQMISFHRVLGHVWGNASPNRQNQGWFPFLSLPFVPSYLKRCCPHYTAYL